MKKVMYASAILLLTGAVLWLAAKPESGAQQMPELPRFSVGDVEFVRLSRDGTEPLTIHKSENGWLLPDGTAAGKDAVDHLLGDLAGMQVVRVVSRNGDNDGKLGFDGSSTRVALVGGSGDLFVVEIGKQGSDLISTYLKVDGRPEVLAVDRTLLWQVRRRAKDWKAGSQE